MSYAASAIAAIVRRKPPVEEVSDDLARMILQNWNKPTTEIKARCNCTAEQVRAVNRREKYWREKLSISFIVPPKQKENKGNQSIRYTAEQKESATQLGFLIGPTEAAKQTGVTMNTIRVWMRKKGGGK